MDGKTKRYKNGNPAVYRDFTDATWKNMCERDRAMWTEYNEDEHAPIPAEVLEFKQKNNLDTEPCCDDASKCKELEVIIEGLNRQVRLKDKVIDELGAEILALKGTPTGPDSDEEAERVFIKNKLTELGIPFRQNTGLPKLKEKLEKVLEDANNTGEEK